MGLITTTGQEMDLVQLHHLKHEIQEMYKANNNAIDAPTDIEGDAWRLTAAGYADGVVIRVRECAKTEGHKLVRLHSGSSVTLAKAEHDAYAHLANRARIAPENRFIDYRYKGTRIPVRWFPWNPDNIKTVPAHLQEEITQEEML